MQARRAARELTLILFSQLKKQISKYSEKDFENIIVKSVRTLTNNATEDLKLTADSLLKIKDDILNYETDHEINLKRPIGTANKPVPIVMTSDFISKIDELMNVAEKALIALETAEMTTLEEKSEVKNYILKIVKAYQENSEEIDNYIQKYALGWNIDRLVRIDKDILRIAISEFLFVKDAPLKVVIDEALELAKKYSTDDSSSFINGILGKVVEEQKAIKR